MSVKSEKPVWPGSWAKDYRAAEMLRLDLEAAASAPSADLAALAAAAARIRTDLDSLLRGLANALGR